jgi:hypothetical protein
MFFAIVTQTPLLSTLSLLDKFEGIRFYFLPKKDEIA